MPKFANQRQIQKLDSGKILDSINLLDKQIGQAWQETGEINLTENYKNCENIVVSGMGGSTLGTHIIKSLFAGELAVPLEIVNGYKLPNFADGNTLCVLSSYSGNTEEVLAIAEEAKQKQLKITGITSGGKLAEFLKKHNCPAYIFNPKYNLSGQPRLGLGYSIIGQLGILTRAGFLNIKKEDIDKITAAVRNTAKLCDINTSEKQNSAKQLALSIYKKIPVIIGSEFLEGNLHILANQINESSKNFAAYFSLPELNHHLLEGLAHPRANKNLHFVFINSNLYDERIKRRYYITEEVAAKNGISYSEFSPRTKTKLEQAFEILVWSSFVSFYLAILNKEDPSKIPWVNYLKNKLREE